MIRHHLVDGLAPPISPSSHGTETGGFVFLTGQIGRDLRDNDRPLPEGIAAQTQRSLDNMKTVLGGLGLALDDVLAMRVFLTHFRRDYETMNTVYDTVFGARPRPSRTCVGVTDLARNALIEIDCIAARPEASVPRAEALRSAHGGDRSASDLAG